VRATTPPGMRGLGVTWVVRMRLVPGPWARRVWALPVLTARCRPVAQAKPRRHKTSVAWGRQLRPPGRRWRPGRPRVVVGAGGLAAVSLALAGGQRQVTRVARRRWEAALDQRPAPHPPGQRGPQPWPGQRQRRLPAWAAGAAPPWETVAVDGYGGRRKHRWGLSHTALGHTRGGPPGDIRFGRVGHPAGKRRLDAFCWTDLPATPVPILAWVVLRGSVEGTFAEGRALLGLETQRHGSAQALARTTPVLFGLCARVTLLALQLSPDAPIPVPVTAWYHKAEPTFSDGLSLVRHHLWRARYLVPSTPEAECRQLPQEALDLLIHGLALAA
jgi:hypothetical protein